jgi:hypothetical protein
VWVSGKEFIKSSSATVTIPNTTGLYYIYFDTTGTLGYQTDYFTWQTEAPVAYVYWNAVAGTSYYFADERHGIALDWATHEYLHRTRGAAFANGFVISNYTTIGTGTTNADAQIDLAGGVFFDEDLKITITHSSTPSQSYEQDLQGPARIPVIYRSGVGGLWVKDSATDYPLKQGTAYPKYNLNTTGTWTTPDTGNNKYWAMWVVATHHMAEPVMAIMGQRQDSNFGNAQDENTWEGLDLDNFPSQEFRPLYRLIFQSGGSNTPHCALKSVLDYRQGEIREAAAVGTTTGLGEVVEDLNPQLGGNLDVNGFSIVSVSNGNIALTPNGTGNLILDGLNWPQADGTANYVLQTNGSGQLSWVAQDSGGLDNVVEDLTPQLGGDLDLNGFRLKDGTDIIAENLGGSLLLYEGLQLGAGNLVMSNPTYAITSQSNENLTVKSLKTSSADAASIVLEGAVNGGITLTADGSGRIHLASELRTKPTTGTPSNYEHTYFEGSLAEPVTWLKILNGTVVTRTAKSITAQGSAQVSSLHNKFGGASILLDGTGDYITVPTTSEFAFASGTYSFECWIYATTVSVAQTVFDFRSAVPSSTGLTVSINSSNQLLVSNNSSTIIGAGGTISVNTWHHIAVTNAGTGLKLWLDGTQVGATYVSSVALGTTQPLSVGAAADGTSAFTGHIDEIRVSSTARYTATFTSPSSALSNDNNTLLLVHADTTIADDVTDDVYYLPLFK